MRLEHFEALRPVCPLCRRSGTLSPLAVTLEIRATPDRLEEGILGCPQASCLREYPVIDGLPFLVGDLRSVISSQLEDTTLRSDLSPALESLIGDCCGPGSAFDARRQRLSTYGRDHWGDQDPDDEQSPAPGSIARLTERALELAGEPPPGPVLDVGCGPGRSTFELASRLRRPALGVDLGVSLLGMAGSALRGAVRYPKRRVGLVYERREFPVRTDFPEGVDFWLADAEDLPLAVGFSMVVALNVLDCVKSPREALLSMASCLAPGGLLVLSTPFDWAPSATPVEGWIGGHSQRGPEGGRSESALRALLTGFHPAGLPGLEVVAEDEVPWRLRLHDRAAMEYTCHLLVVKVADSESSSTSP